MYAAGAVGALKKTLRTRKWISLHGSRASSGMEREKGLWNPGVKKIKKGLKVRTRPVETNPFLGLQRLFESSDSACRMHVRDPVSEGRSSMTDLDSSCEYY
ncbi:hypothetical protein NDU88_006661 [Pleurodeles waltl]|uniref:Uncharacterized protein n=1 Tax=Pleurodeles waltl TaxID=8319 RepID=A0AAV7VPR2_PLEWA|nr:hypothetical protein NDU88_006661 [Pleurodeles waltl]